MINHHWRQQVAAAVRSVKVYLPIEGGLCVFRTMMGAMALMHFGMPHRVIMGSMVYRVGPDERADVVAYCGRYNSAQLPGLFHTWLEADGHIVDFSCGDWRTEYAPDDGDKGLPPIRWEVDPPEYIWRPAAELTAPWTPTGTPELGVAWYRAGIPLIDVNEAQVRSYFDRCIEGSKQLVAPLWPSVKRALPPPLPNPPGKAEARRLRQMRKREEQASRAP
jgi:hypothetical protein